MKSFKEYIGRREAERLDFPECWEEVDSKEWIHLLWLRQQLMERKAEEEQPRLLAAGAPVGRHAGLDVAV